MKKIISLIINFLLIPVARVFIFILSPVGVAWELVRNPSVEYWGKYFKKIAVSYDQTGNAINGQMLTDCLGNGEGEKFGNPDETVSGIVGKKKKSNTLSHLGWAIAVCLNKIEKDHVEKAIEEDEQS